jgi:DNA-binding GntR family transcriptional regulator
LLAESAYEAVRNRISEGTLRPGDALPEAKLAQDLGMSRSPIRDALRRLSHDGLVNFVPKKGYFVESLSSQDIADIYDLREVIEGLAAKRLARWITPEQAQTLRELAEKVDRRAATLGDAMEFHSAIFQMCGSRKIAEAARSLRLQLITYDERTHRLTSSHDARIPDEGNTWDIHRILAEKIISGNPREAEEAAREHVRLAKRLTAMFMMGIEDDLLEIGDWSQEGAVVPGSESGIPNVWLQTLAQAGCLRRGQRVETDRARTEERTKGEEGE